MSGIKIPTEIRPMTWGEYNLLTGRVYGSTLLARWRILITNGAGIDGRAFCIPTSLISTLGATTAAGFLGLLAGYLTSFINVGYLMNVGGAYQKSLNLGSQRDKNLLVHETAHVWQGHNSKLSLTYVFKSCIDQCTLSNAYNYQIGQDWHSYGVEQQAQIIEDWFDKGELRSGDLWNYIENYVRKGKA